MSLEVRALKPLLRVVAERAWSHQRRCASSFKACALPFRVARCVVKGLCALMAIVLLGPRDGVTFNAQGLKRAPMGQSPTLRTLGTLSLW